MAKYALIVGIDHYNPAAYGQGADLKYCKYDAGRVLARVGSLVDEVTQIADSDATASEVIANIRRLASMAKAGDSVMIYQSSHGTMYEANEGGVSGLCCYDAVVWDFQIYELLKLFQRGVRLTMIFDTCHSESNHRAPVGAVRRFAPPPPAREALPKVATNRSLRGMPLKSLVHMAACTWDSYSYEIQVPTEGREVGGVFTTALCKSLDINPKATAAAIIGYATEYCKGLQTPVLNVKGGLTVRLKTII